MLRRIAIRFIEENSGRCVERHADRPIGANVLIENKAGASGILAGVALKDAPPDGTVIMFAPSSATVAQKVTRKSMPFDLEKDLAPIGMAGTTATVYVVSPTIGVSNMSEYVTWLKRNPGRASFGTAAMGSSTHFFGVEIGQAIGIPLQPIAYKGTGPMLTDLAGGHIAAGCGGVTSFLQHHRTGKLRIIADSSPKRSKVAPDLPTIGELGYPKLAHNGFYGFYAPARTRPEVIDAWNRELRAVLDTPDMHKRLADLGLDVETSTPAEFAERQARDIVAFTRSMKAAGFEPE